MKSYNLNMFGEGEGVESGERKLVLERDDYTCQDCGTKVSQSRGGDGEFANIHHIVPLSEGGSDELDNLTTLCRRCHLEAHHEQRDWTNDRNPNAKFTWDDIRDIRRREESATPEELAEEYDTTPGYIRTIWRGDVWTEDT